MDENQKHVSGENNMNLSNVRAVSIVDEGLVKAPSELSDGDLLKSTLTTSSEQHSNANKKVKSKCKFAVILDDSNSELNNSDAEATEIEASLADSIPDCSSIVPNKFPELADYNTSKPGSLEHSTNRPEEHSNAVEDAKSKRKSRLILDDSDSDGDVIHYPETINLEVAAVSEALVINDASEHNELKLLPEENLKKKHKSVLMLDDSDSDSEQSNNDKVSNKNTSNMDKAEEALTATTRRHKRIAAFNSDSESESMQVASPLNKSFDHGVSNKQSDNAVVYMTNSKGEIVPETQSSIQKSRLSMLCDSDSEEEVAADRATTISDNEIIESTQHQELKKPNKPTSKSKVRKSKLIDIEDQPKKMTPKEAAEQRKEIQSESQRMLREKNLSLPYHRPKSHSLKEFLARRPKLLSAALVVGRAHPSVAIKMSAEQLEIISKKLKEREKEVKEFYQSESESDDNDDFGSEYVPPPNDEKLKESNPDNSDHVEVATDLNEDCLLAINSDNQEQGNIETADNACLDAASIIENDGELSEDMVKDLYAEKGICTSNQTEPSMDVDNLESNVMQSSFEANIDKSCESYDFNIEDEHTEKTDATIHNEQPDEGNAEESNPPNFSYTDLDREIEQFGDAQEVVAPNKSKLELLRERLAKDKPKLSGGPNEVIDLDSGIAKPHEVVQLMERFVKHASAKTKKHHHSKQKVKLSIVTVESGGDIHKEEVAMNVDSDEESALTEEKPGAKLHKLREELQKQMDQKKTEIWQAKAAKGIRGGTDNAEDGEKDIIDYDEEEAEMTDEEDTDEEIEDDIELTDKPRKKSDFIDGEAEVSEDEEGDRPKEGYEALVENEETNDSNRGEEIEQADDSNLSEHPPENSGENQKVLKRILKPADDDDSDDDDSDTEVLYNDSLQKSHLDSTVTADEDEFPSAQPRQLRTPIRPAVSQTKSISDFLTPISFITSIQNLASSSKIVRDGPSVSPFRMPLDMQSPNLESSSMPQKQLFVDSQVPEAEGSQACGYLNSNDITQLTDETRILDTNEEPPSTQDLLGICSGEFTGVTQLELTKSSIEVSSSQSELKSLGQEDMVISQLLDEEELELFKKKFESPINPTTQSIGEADVIGGGIIDSDDEDEESQQQTRKRKNQKRIQFSDDESSEHEDEMEEIDLHDRDELSDRDVEYDSEENEIDLNAEGKKNKLKLADFFEAEAELSESEWGSEDEDEKGLDQLEFEFGDTEKFDEDQVKSDLEKIHLRRMLDDDTREVKLLQELYLEDGEMHGTGRQRQFKWKNIDLTDGPAEAKETEEDVYFDEEESEEQWRKQRHEREMFLKKQQQKSRDTAEDLLCDSQLLKLGRKFLQRSSTHNSQNSTPAEKSKGELESPLKNTPFSLQHMRGSFLNRNDQVLTRVAEYTKVSAEISAASRKTTKHFLFQSVSTTEISRVTAEGKKRKASEGTPNVIKKLRLNTNLSPAVKKKLDKPQRSKKLFNF